MEAQQLLGLPLDTALERLGEDAARWRVTLTADPKRSREDGTLRVIRVRDGELVAARFYDGVPQKHTKV